MSTIYLAHPIDFAGPNRDKITKVVSEIAFELNARGAAVYRPADAWSARPPFNAKMQQINELVLAQCDAVIVYHPVGVSSIGVPYELAIGSLSKPTIVIRGEDGYTPAMDSVVLTAVADVVPFYTENEIEKAVSALLRVLEIMQRTPDSDDRAIAKWHGTGEAPSAAHEGDAGFDLTYNGDTPIVVKPGVVAQIPSGVHIQLPDGCWAMVTGRSSSFKRGLLVPISVIDAGFRGELFAVCKNISDETVTIAPGERIAQIVPMPLLAPHMRWQFDTLDSSDRGDRGFGSTGR